MSSHHLNALSTGHFAKTQGSAVQCEPPRYTWGAVECVPRYPECKRGASWGASQVEGVAAGPVPPNGGVAKHFKVLGRTSDLRVMSSNPIPVRFDRQTVHASQTGDLGSPGDWRTQFMYAGIVLWLVPLVKRASLTMRRAPNRDPTPIQTV